MEFDKHINVFGDRLKIEKNLSPSAFKTIPIGTVLLVVGMLLRVILDELFSDPQIIYNIYVCSIGLILVIYVILFVVKAIKYKEIDWFLILLFTVTTVLSLRQINVF